MSKDFLEQFTKEEKPASFNKEELVKIEKKSAVTKPLIISLYSLTVVILVICYFTFFKANIKLLDFVGSKSEDISIFIKQNKIESTGIVIKQEYSMEVEKDYVISQSVKPDSYVKNDVKITFVVSNGPNPEDQVNFPDIKSMTKDEIESWIKNNKLLKTNINISYDDNIVKDSVISYELSGKEENFKRGSSLTISISKGKKPAEEVTVIDMVGKNINDSIVSNFKSSNNIEFVETKTYSHAYEVGTIIYQSIKSGEKVEKGSKINITVSSGSGLYVDNLMSMSQNKALEWIGNNSASINIYQKYSNESRYVLSQSISAGRIIGPEEKIDITVNLGNYFYFSNEFPDITNVSKLEEQIKQLQSKGLNINYSVTGETYSDKVKGEILSISSIKSENTNYNKEDKLPLDVTINVVISKGRQHHLALDGLKNQNGKFDVVTISNYLAELGISYSIETSNVEVELYVNDQNRTSENNIKINDDERVVLK